MESIDAMPATEQQSPVVDVSERQGGRGHHSTPNLYRNPHARQHIPVLAYVIKCRNCDYSETATHPAQLRYLCRRHMAENRRHRTEILQQYDYEDDMKRLQAVKDKILKDAAAAQAQGGGGGGQPTQ